MSSPKEQPVDRILKINPDIENFYDFKLILDKDESKAFIEGLKKSTEKVDASLKRAEERFNNIDISANFIPIKIKKREKR